MYYTRVFSKNSNLLWWFILCMVKQASSRTCYVCESRINETCSTGVDKGAFELDCSKDMIKFSKSTDASSEILQAIINGYSQEYLSQGISNFDCATARGKSLNEEKIVRVCIPMTMNWSTLEDHTMASGFLIDSRSRCRADLCNRHLPGKVLKEATKQKNSHSSSQADKTNYLTTIVFLMSTFLRFYF